MHPPSENDAIRAAVLRASSLEAKREPFRLFGRGHEPRVTLDRRLAAALRGVAIPCVSISGYGANYFYPQRVFRTAVRLLKKSLGWSPIGFSDHGSCIRIDQRENLKNERATLHPSRPGIAVPSMEPMPSAMPDPMMPTIAELKAVMRKKAPVIGPGLAVHLSRWAAFIRPNNFSAGTDDWRVIFLKWALKGRAKAFVDWANAQTTPEASQALAGIRMVYDYAWPHNASCGYIFMALWGWLQLELEKPGESKPASIAEQMEGLTLAAEKAGRTIKRWEYTGCGGVMAVWDDE